MNYFLQLLNGYCTPVWRLALLISLIAPSTNQAQILDDSTKQVYGPKTTSYVLEQDFLYNRYKRINTDSSWSNMSAPYNLDTSLNDLHNYTFLFKNNTIYQDLGNLGTPIKSIFYHPPTQIGKTLGFNVFDVYAIDPKKIRYTDTKSPYTQLTYVQSGNGQQVMNVDHSRNINPNWNVGFIFRRNTSQKIAGSLNPFNNTSVRKPQASHYSVSFYTRYFTKNERYQLLFNFTHLHHTNYDIGGVIKKKYYDTTFLYKEERVNLYLARTIDRREDYHLFHEYSMNKTKTLQIYHQADFTKRQNRFNELTSVTQAANVLDFAYYSKNTFGKPNKDSAQFRFSNNLINDKTEYRLLENRIGLKGNIRNLSYNFYLRRKDMLSYRQPSYSGDTLDRGYKKNGKDTNFINRKYTENFLGANIGYFLKDSSFVKIEGEFLFAGTTSDGVKTLNDQKLTAEYYYKYFQFGVSRYAYSPSLVQQQYRGNLPEWNHVDSGQFKLTNYQQLYAGLKVKTKFFELQPKVTYDRIANFIYYDTLALPRQNQQVMNFLYADLHFNIKVWKFHLQSSNRYTIGSGKIDNIVEVEKIVPRLFNHNRIFFQSFLFKKATIIQVGVDTYWKSTYNADKYMPVTQQFYINNNFPVRSYLLIDAFLNAQIKSFRVFLRMSHVNMGSDNGYYITPYYPGLPRSFDFGLNWRFYN